MIKRYSGLLLGSMLASSPVLAAEFVCQDDVKAHVYSAAEQELVDRFWAESLTYLGQYLKTLETPTGQCKDSAEATIQTFDSRTGKQQTRCIMRYRDMELLANISARCWRSRTRPSAASTRKRTTTHSCCTPSAKVQELSPVSSWLKRPLSPTTIARWVGRSARPAWSSTRTSSR